MNQRDSADKDSSLLMSIPAYNRYIDPYRSIEEVRYQSLSVMFNNPKDKAVAVAFQNDCLAALDASKDW